MRALIIGLSAMAIALPTVAFADGNGAVTGAAGGAVAGAVVGARSGPRSAAAGGIIGGVTSGPRTTVVSRFPSRLARAKRRPRRTTTPAPASPSTRPTALTKAA